MIPNREFKLSELSKINSSASEIDGSVKKTTISPNGVTAKGVDIVDFSTLNNVVFNPVESSTVYSVVNESFFGGDNYIQLNDTTAGRTSKIIIPCNFSLLGATHISFYVWVDGYANFGNVVLELGLDGGTSFFNKLSYLCKTKMTALPNHWNNIRIPISALTLAGTATTQSNIKSIRITADGIAGKKSNIRYGGLKLDAKQKTAITFTFDDGMYSDYTVVMPKLNSYGFKFTTFIISSLIGSSFGGARLTLAQLREILENGNYIGVHGTSLTTNWVSTATLAQAEQHIYDCLKYIIDNGLSNDGMHYAAYPMGEYNDDIIALLKKYNFKGARTTDLKTQNMPVESLYKLKLGFVMAETLEENIALLEDRISKGGLINIYQHEISTNSVNDPISPEVFNAFIDYIYQNYRELVTTIPEWVNSYENGILTKA